MKQLREIKNRWTGAIIHSGETNTIAELAIANKANLSGVNLSDAGLSDADLRGADLRGADLSGAKGIIPVALQIGGSKHWIVVREIRKITIGCMHETIEWWEEHYRAVGRKEGYTDAQVEEYAEHIRYCKTWMEKHGALKLEEKPVAPEERTE